MMKRLITDTSEDSNKKPKLEADPESIQLINIPIEILEEIVKNLPFVEYPKMRATCALFRDVVDDILIRKLIHKKRLCDKNPSNSHFECIRSKVFYQLSWAYARSGYRPTVACGYQSVLTVIDYENLVPELMPFIGRKLYNFCQCIDIQLGDLNSKLSRLLYIVTILGFLNKLRNAVRIENQINPAKLKLNFIINGAWIGLMGSHSGHRNILLYPEDRNYVLLFLADAMTSNLTKKSIRNMWFSKGSNRSIVYGIEDDYSEYVFLELMINGSNKLQEFLKTSPVIEDWVDLPTDNFTVTLKIACITQKKVHKYCPTNTTCSLQI